jgi:hypothetical protein
LQLRVDACQEFFRKAGPDSAGELEPVRTLVANEQGTKIFPVPFGQRVTADYELARLGDVVFDPGTAAPAAFVERISSFGDQSLEAELLGNAEQFIFAAAELVRGRVVSVTRAEGGLVAPVEFSDEFAHKYFAKALQAVLHQNRSWGYPIALETVTLIYNRKLLDGPPPTELSQLEPLNQKIKTKHPGVTTILWDYESPYYSWGILDSADGYVFGKNGTDYNLTDVGVANPESVEGLSRIITLVQAGILPKSVSYSAVEEMMGRAKLAMMISGPWSWANLRQHGINFAVAPMLGVNGKPGRPFVGVMVAYLNRSSSNQDLAKEFLEQSMLTGEGLSARELLL